MMDCTLLGRNDTASRSDFGRLADLVRAEIQARLGEGAPRICEVAEALGMQRWTLQRRLEREGINFFDLVDQMRSELAGQYLGQIDLPITDIALLLGYSETSAFTRACRRWYGAPPVKVRAAHA